MYTKAVVINSTGYGYVDVKADVFSLMEGDVIAHSAFGGAVLAQVSQIQKYFNAYYFLMRNFCCSI